MGPLILVVDASRQMRAWVGRALAADGYRVVEAGNGAEALALLEAMRSAPPGLLITDLYMPLMDGLSLARMVRRQAPWRLLPIVVLTAEDDAAMRLRGHLAGVSLWLVRPVAPDELRRAVSTVLAGAPEPVAAGSPPPAG